MLRSHAVAFQLCSIGKIHVARLTVKGSIFIRTWRYLLVVILRLFVVISLRWTLSLVVVLVMVIVLLLTTLVLHGWCKNFCPELTRQCGLMALRSFLLALCHHYVYHVCSCLLVGSLLFYSRSDISPSSPSRWTLVTPRLIQQTCARESLSENLGKYLLVAA